MQKLTGSFNDATTTSAQEVKKKSESNRWYPSEGALGFVISAPPIGRPPPLDEIVPQGGTVTGGLEIYRSEYIRYMQRYAGISTKTQGKSQKTINKIHSGGAKCPNPR